MTDEPLDPAEDPDEDADELPPQVPLPGEDQTDDEPGGDDDLESSDPVRPDPNA